MLAARKNSSVLVHALLAAGATINHANALGNTALGAASTLADTGILRMLLNAGAGVNNPNHFGNTPLMLAAHACQLAAVKVLVGYGADVGHTNFVGETALAWIAQKVIVGDSSAESATLIRDANKPKTRKTRKHVRKRTAQHDADAPAVQANGITHSTGNITVQKARQACTIKLLLEQGASINHANNSGDTPLGK